MAVVQTQRDCKLCGRKTLHAKNRFSSGWGCFLTIITAGLFLIPWLLLGVLEAFQPWRCQNCGKSKLV